ncbi:hypothetical protein HK407_05g10600, partial [Ordospora pajunii]|uniref:uncharacterized protein n=1 Tax=Ordospora pajunii TaxID=3039483 RepID=UPI00295268EF
LEKTLAAMPKIAAVRKRREDYFIKDRILSGQEANRQSDLEYIERHKQLLCEETDGERDAVRSVRKKEAQMN